MTTDRPDRDLIARLLGPMADDYDVAVLDFRGHGDSGGRYTFGASEAFDLKAVVDYIVEETHLGLDCA